MTSADIAPGIPGTLRPCAAGWRFGRENREWLLAGPQWPGPDIYYARIFRDRVEMLAQGVVAINFAPSVNELVRQADKRYRPELRRDARLAQWQIARKRLHALWDEEDRVREGRAPASHAIIVDRLSTQSIAAVEQYVRRLGGRVRRSA